MATVTIRPNGDSATHDGLWTLTGGTAGLAYTCIDEAITDDSDYISNNDTSSPYDKQAVTLEDMPAASAISSVVMKWRSRCAFSTLSTIPFIRVSGADTEKSSAQVVTTTDTEYSWDITAEQSWTDTLINSLEIGWRKNATANNTLRVTQAWVEITYTASGGGTTETIDLAGTLTTAGTVVKSVSKSQAGTLTSAGTVVKAVAVTKAGTLTSAGSVAQQTNKTLAGTLDTEGDLATLKAAILDLAGTLTTAGTVVWQVAKTLAGTLATAGTVVKLANKSLAGTLTTEGDVANLKAALLDLAGTLVTAGSLTSMATKGLSGTLTTGGDVGRSVAKSLAGALTTAGDLATLFIAGGGAVVDEVGALIGRARSSQAVVAVVRSGQALVARARALAGIVARVREE